MLIWDDDSFLPCVLLWRTVRGETSIGLFFLINTLRSVNVRVLTIMSHIDDDAYLSNFQ